MSTDVSRVDLVKYRGKETVSTLLEANNMSIREAPDGVLVVELFRYGSRDDKPVEGYQMRFSPEDRARLRAKC